MDDDEQTGRERRKLAVLVVMAVVVIGIAAVMFMNIREQTRVNCLTALKGTGLSTESCSK